MSGTGGTTSNENGEIQVIEKFISERNLVATHTKKYGN
jgi:hypothetical protein